MIFHILSSRVESSEIIGFDSDGYIVIIDDYANSHLCSEKDTFTNKIYTIITNGMETICGNDLIPKGIGTVSWSSTDNKGQLHTKKLNNVNLLSRITSQHTK